MPSEELKEGEIVHRTLLNQPVALYRKEDGSVAAIRDMCPHRQVPLSMGTLQSGDRGTGASITGFNSVPTANACTTRMAARKFPKRCTCRPTQWWKNTSFCGSGWAHKPADLDKIPDYSVIDDAEELHITDFGYLNAKCHYGLMIDNLLDLSHICFTHAGILGNPDTAETDPDVTVEGDTVTVSRFSEDAENARHDQNVHRRSRTAGPR